MPVNSRTEELNFHDNDRLALQNDLIAFERLHKRYKPIIRALLKMYSCEKCGECCRKEKVSSSLDDLKKLKAFDENILHNALDEVKISLFTLKVPCQYLNGNNNTCKCYGIRPLPCTYYPFIFVYGYFISIAYCPYGMKIINDLVEYCKLKGILIEDYDKDECSNTLMKGIITKIDTLYKDMGLDRKEEEKTKMLNVPYTDLEDFYKWIKIKKKNKKQAHM